MPYYTSIVSLLAIALYFSFGLRVAGAHRKYNVKLPAMTGDPSFERIYRVQLNTLEWAPNFFVPLWLCAYFLSDIGAAVLGVVWMVGRVMYSIGYATAVEKRIPGFLIQAIACFLLFIGAAVGLFQHMPA